MKPVCSNIMAKVALSRRVKGKWRLIGWGKVLSGVQTEIDNSLGPPSM